jgi:hypothetical protein
MDEWFHMDECCFCMDKFDLWLKDKYIQILISQTWMSFNNDGGESMIK